MFSPKGRYIIHTVRGLTVLHQCWATFHSNVSWWRIQCRREQLSLISLTFGTESRFLSRLTLLSQIPLWKQSQRADSSRDFCAWQPRLFVLLSFLWRWIVELLDLIPIVYFAGLIFPPCFCSLSGLVFLFSRQCLCLSHYPSE